MEKFCEAEFYCDVAVCGGGVAGAVTAIASALNGAETVLIEKELFLGGDNYYYYLALILALLCHKKYDSYSKEDFRKLANECDMEKICALDDKTLRALLEQLVKLEVFAKDKQDENKYGFRRFHLFELMGTEKDIQNQLIDLMAKEEEAIIQWKKLNKACW